MPLASSSISHALVTNEVSLDLLKRGKTLGEEKMTVSMEPLIHSQIITFDLHLDKSVRLPTLVLNHSCMCN